MTRKGWTHRALAPLAAGFALTAGLGLAACAAPRGAQSTPDAEAASGAANRWRPVLEIDATLDVAGERWVEDGRLIR